MRPAVDWFQPHSSYPGAVRKKSTSLFVETVTCTMEPGYECQPMSHESLLLSVVMNDLFICSNDL